MYASIYEELFGESEEDVHYELCFVVPTYPYVYGDYYLRKV